MLIGDALRLLWRPEQTWDAVRSAAPKWQRLLYGIIAPLSLLPAVAWPLGHAADPAGPGEVTLRSLAASAGSAFALCVATVLVVAAAIYMLAPLFSVQRGWDRAVAVASYSSVPVFLASPLLASAVLTIVVIVAFFHACFLCSLGLRRVLGCRGEDASLYVAAAGFVSALAGLLLGGLSSAAGIL